MHGSIISALGARSMVGDTYTLLCFQDCCAALRDAASFSSCVYDEKVGPAMGEIILGMDGPEHRKRRNLVARAFRQSTLERWEDSLILPICNELVDRFAGVGRADLVSDYAFEIPIRVISAILGLPVEDLSQLRRWSSELIGVGADIGRALGASAGLTEYFARVVASKRKHPGDDVISDLAEADVDGEVLADEVIYSFLRLLLSAGTETTFRSIGNMMYLLASHPDQLARIASKRALIAQAVEEALRVEPPVLFISRRATRDVRINGVTIPEGASVEVCLGSANHDEARWVDPDEFDILRPAKPHLAFGTGAHMCLGLHLARMEMRVALNVLLERLDGLRLEPFGDEGDARDPHIRGLVFRSPDALPVVFERSE